MESARARGRHDVRPAFGFVLLAARDEPTSGTEIAALMGISKQAASKLLDAMGVSGYVARQKVLADKRQRTVNLTTRGRALLLVVEEIYPPLRLSGPGSSVRTRLSICAASC
jgi:DNA-binding MarR family transcriptional regulator